MSFSENAILTKSRAIYGRRLTPQDYKELLACSTIEEAASYLGSKTHYSDVFSDVTTAKINSAMIENMLKKRLAEQFLSLCHFARILGTQLYRYLVIKNDISEILSCIRYLKTPGKYDYLINMPVFLDKMTTVDMYKLARCESFDEIVDELKGTDYYNILNVYRDSGSDVDMLGIESSLNRYLYIKTREIADKKLHGSEKKEFISFLNMMADMKLLSDIYRLKTYFKASAEEIVSYNICTGVTSFTDKQLKAIMGSDGREGFFDAVKHTVYGKKLEKNEFTDIEHWLNIYEYKEASYKAIYSTHPNVVMFCCIYLAENEVRNITHIIEGIKYNVSPQEIAGRLIGCGELKEGGKQWL